MSDLNWCTYCDNAINPYSESLYCGERCLKADALQNHPFLGYNWHEFEDFLRPALTNSKSTSSQTISPSLTASSSTSASSPASLPPLNFDFILLPTDNNVATIKPPSFFNVSKRTT